jgi:acetaldehyde dehydrogenase (acetylating)
LNTAILHIQFDAYDANAPGCTQVMRLAPAVFTEVDAQASNLVNILMPETQ